MTVISADAPATVHYDVEDGTYVVEQDGEIQRKYGGKGPLTDEWTRIYEPVIPEAVFREHGNDSVPEPDAFRIAIVPNDDRNLDGDPDLLMFDTDTEDVVPIGDWVGSSQPSSSSSESSLEGEADPGSPESVSEPDHEPAPEPPEQKPDPERPPEELYPTLTAREGYLTRQELIDRYEEQSGFAFDEPRFYVVLATYKVGALGEMFLRRYLEGNSDDPLYPKMENGVPRLLEQATSIVDGEYDV